MKDFLFSLLFIAFFTVLFTHESEAQITLTENAAVIDYLEGTWELRKHYYGIGGWQDSFPSPKDAYHYNFERTDSDSVMLLTLYHNKCWVADSYLEISKYLSPQGFESWLIFNFLSFYNDDLKNFFINENESSQDMLELFQDPDASQYTLERTDTNFSEYCDVTENYEFLDHGDKCNFIAGSKLVSDGIIYATNFYNQSLDFRGTAIFKASLNNTIDTLYRNSFDTRIKMKELGDTTLSFLITDFWDYDFGVGGFDHITITNGNISNLNEVNDHHLSNCVCYVLDAVPALNSNLPLFQKGYWILLRKDQNTKLLFYSSEAGTVITEFDVPEEYTSLFKDKDESIYLIRNKIAKWEGDSLTIIQEIDEFIREVRTYNNLPHALTKSKIIRYHAGFRTAIDTIQLPENVDNYRNIILEPSGISVLQDTSASSEAKLYNIQYNNDITRVWTLPKNENETYTDLISRTDESVVVSGTSSCQTFHRQINLDPARPNIYAKENISLESFTLRAQESMQNQQVLEATLEIKNLGTNFVEVTDAYSNNYMATNFDITDYVDINFKLSIAPNETRIMKDTIYASQGKDFSNLTISNTGANHRFNESAQTISVELLSATNELTETTTISIYPNPNNGLFRISGTEPQQAISIYNKTGELIYFQTGKRIEKTIDLSSFPAGQYFLQSEEKYTGIKNCSSFVITN